MEALFPRDKSLYKVHEEIFKCNVLTSANSNQAIVHFNDLEIIFFVLGNIYRGVWSNVNLVIKNNEVKTNIVSEDLNKYSTDLNHIKNTCKLVQINGAYLLHETHNAKITLFDIPTDVTRIYITKFSANYEKKLMIDYGYDRSKPDQALIHLIDAKKEQTKIPELQKLLVEHRKEQNQEKIEEITQKIYDTKIYVNFCLTRLPFTIRNGFENSCGEDITVKGIKSGQSRR